MGWTAEAKMNKKADGPGARWSQPLGALAVALILYGRTDGRNAVHRGDRRGLAVGVIGITTGVAAFSAVQWLCQRLWRCRQGKV
jgi:hypothetical protein